MGLDVAQAGPARRLPVARSTSKCSSNRNRFPAAARNIPEVGADRLWEAMVKKLLHKDYKWDAGFFGSLNEFSRKIAYFFHASLQGTACYPGAAEALRHVASSGLTQGLLADGQCFTVTQLQRGLAQQDDSARLDDLLGAERALAVV